MEKKFLKITIITILLICVCATIVNAYSFTATMTPSSTTVAESKEFSVQIKVSNLDVGNNGINSLSGYFKYDESVFETINESSIEGLNHWAYTYNSENGKITLTKTTFVKEEEAVFQVTLKTKAGTSGKEGTINFNNIMASNSAQEISASDISITIVVGEEDANVANTTTANATGNAISISINPANNTVNNTVENTTNNTTNNSVVSSYVNNSSSNSDIPYTGVEDTIVYIIGAVIALAVIFYIKFEKINKDMK